jgi:hypothetical protein
MKSAKNDFIFKYSINSHNFPNLARTISIQNGYVKPHFVSKIFYNLYIFFQSCKEHIQLTGQ